MKTLYLPTGGHARSNQDLNWLQDAILQVGKGITRSLTNSNSAPIILWGVQPTVVTGGVQLSDGQILWNDEIFDFPVQLYPTGGANVYITINANYAANNPIPNYSGINKYVHAQRTITMYAASSPSNPSDALASTMQSFQAVMANALGFNASNYLINTPPTWNVIGTTGQPSFFSGWTHFNTSYPVAFSVDQLGLVRLRGRVKKTFASNNDIFIFPSTFSLVNGDKNFTCPINTNSSASVTVSVYFNGTNTLIKTSQSILAVNDYIDLTGVSFYL